MLFRSRAVKVLANVALNTQMERVHCRPWGLAGGMEGAGNGYRLRIDGKELADFPNGKMFRRLKPGDVYTLMSGGGGGFGSPVQRDPEKVAHDVRQGYVSDAIAQEIYKVALTPEGTVDVAATVRLRESRM